MTSQPPFSGQSPILIAPIQPKTHPLAIFTSIIASISLVGIPFGFSTIVFELENGGHGFENAPTPIYDVLFIVTAVTFLLAFAGIILGHIGLRSITRNSGHYKGAKQTTVSLIICYLSLSMVICNETAVVVIAFFQLARSL